MSKKIKIILSSLLLLSVIGYFGFNYLVYGGARNVENEKTDFTSTSTDILNEYTSNVDKANIKYLEKAVALNGLISSISETEIILDQTIICSLKNAEPTLKVGDKVTIKGRVVGFDDLMGELKLDQCFCLKE